MFVWNSVQLLRFLIFCNEGFCEFSLVEVFQTLGLESGGFVRRSGYKFLDFLVSPDYRLVANLK